MAGRGGRGVWGVSARQGGGRGMTARMVVVCVGGVEWWQADGLHGSVQLYAHGPKLPPHHHSMWWPLPTPPSPSQHVVVPSPPLPPPSSPPLSPSNDVVASRFPS